MKRLLLLFSLFFIFGCSGSKGGSGGSSTLTAEEGSCTGNGDGNNSLPSVSGSNVMTITINGLGVCSYNQPCTSVSICSPGTSTCQTVTDLLVDTGSYGLRVFDSVLTTPSLTQATDSGGGLIAECMNFGSANTWGPVKLADVKWGASLLSAIYPFR